MGDNGSESQMDDSAQELLDSQQNGPSAKEEDAKDGNNVTTLLELLPSLEHQEFQPQQQQEESEDTKPNRAAVLSDTTMAATITLTGMGTNSSNKAVAYADSQPPRAKLALAQRKLGKERPTGIADREHDEHLSGDEDDLSKLVVARKAKEETNARISGQFVKKGLEESNAKNAQGIERSTEDIERSTKGIEGSTKGIEGSTKGIEPIAEDIEPIAEDIEPIAEDIQRSAEDVERGGPRPELLGQPPVPLSLSLEAPSLARSRNIERVSEPGAHYVAQGEAMRRVSGFILGLFGVTSLHDVTTVGAESSAGVGAEPFVQPHINLEGLVEARPVNDPHSLDIPVAQEVDTATLEPSQASRKKAKMSQMRMGCLLIGICVLLGVGFSQLIGRLASSRPLSSEAPALMPSISVTAAPTTVHDGLLLMLPNYTRSRIDNPRSPQHQAFQWVLGHRNITTLPDWRKKQLFALATFFYAMEGKYWPTEMRSQWMNDTTHECDWYTSDETSASMTWTPSWGTWEPGRISPCSLNGEYEMLRLNGLHLEDSARRPSIPPEIAFLAPKLHTLELSQSEFWNLSLLELFPLDVWESLSELKHVLLWNNNLVGRVPIELGVLTKLESLILYMNKMHGSIPSELGTMSALSSLFLYMNLLTGAIPSELGLLQQLARLNIGENQLTGSIPSELGMTALTWLELGNNQLSGSIPKDLMQLTDWFVLNLGTNQFKGTIPSELGLSIDFDMLELSDNQMTGPIPSELGMLTQISSIYLAGNRLTGSLPSELGKLQVLRILMINGTDLSGTMPSELRNLRDMMYLDLSDLPLVTGPVRDVVGGKLLSFYFMKGTPFQGTVPDTLCFLVEGPCYYSDRYPDCVLEFDCSSTLCGCNCPCANNSLP